jgi:hypothetical protein
MCHTLLEDTGGDTMTGRTDFITEGFEKVELRLTRSKAPTPWQAAQHGRGRGRLVLQ